MSHAKDFSPSASLRWLNCPRSVSLSRQAPKQLTSPYAEEGTLAHAVAERILLGQSVENVDDKDMLTHALNYGHYVVGVAKDRHLEVEKNLLLDKEVWGTGDCVIGFYGDEHIDVVDFKYGMVEVNADAPQLKLYGLMAMLEYGAKTVTTHVFQPRAEHIDTATFTRDELFFFWDEVKDAIESAKDESTDYCRGVWCKYCPGLSICPAQLDDFDQVLPDVRQLDGDMIAQILDKAPVVEAFIKEVRARALEAADRGEKIPGYKRVMGRRPARRWGEFPADLKISSKAYERKMLSPTQLEKKHPVVYRKLAEHVVQGEAKPTLAPMSDKRKELPSSVEDDFTVVPN